MEARRQLESVRRHFKVTAARQDQSHAEQVRRLAARMVKLQEQSQSQRHSIDLMHLNLERSLTLAREGVLSPAKVDEARETLAQAQRQLGQSEQSLEQLTQETAALENGHQDSLWQRRQTIQNAEVRVEALAFMLGQTVLEATECGAAGLAMILALMSRFLGNLPRGFDSRVGENGPPGTPLG